MERMQNFWMDLLENKISMEPMQKTTVSAIFAAKPGKLLGPWSRLGQNQYINACTNRV
jgi:putative ABC transport system ATP-binding protein